MCCEALWCDVTRSGAARGLPHDAINFKTCAVGSPFRLLLFAHAVASFVMLLGVAACAMAPSALMFRLCRKRSS